MTTQADRAVRFIGNLTHTGGNNEGKPFELRPWQENIIRRLFGTHKPDGTRQYETCFLFLPRKQGKTELSAAIMLYCLLGQGKRGQEIYSAAADRRQAAKLFQVAATMIRNDPWLLDQCEIVDSAKTIRHPASNSVYQALSAEANTKFGDRPSVILFDELHAQTSRKLWSATLTGFATATEPLTIIISTAGEDKAGLCKEQFDYARKVESGEIQDPTYLPVLYYAEPDEDWADETTWRKAMPALGDFCRLEHIQKEYKQAKEIGAKETEFRLYYLNQWVQADSNAWMDVGKWNACRREYKLEDLYGLPAWGGLDCSRTTDWSSFVLCVPKDGIVYTHCLFWIPLAAGKRREAQDPLLWRHWQRTGLAKIQEGEALDRNLIADDVHALCQHFDLQLISADRNHAHEALLRLRDVYGYQIDPFAQAAWVMYPAVVELETAILKQELAHNNEILTWQIGNARTTAPDKNGNYALTKARSADKIDGVVALLMGYMRCKEGMYSIPSVYEQHGIEVIEVGQAPSAVPFATPGQDLDPFKAALQRKLAMLGAG